MFKLIEPANQIVKQKKKQFELRQSTLNQTNPQKPAQTSSNATSFINDQNYDEYCILVYDFFKMNSERIQEAGQLRGYIEKGEGKE